MSIHLLRKRFRPQLTVPGAYIALALVLGLAVPRAGEQLLPGVLSRITEESAIAMLSAIASGMMALTGIAFSLLLIFLQLSNTTYTPRLLAEITRDKRMHHVLGIFSGTFLYSTIAIRAVGLSERPHALIALVAFIWLFGSVTALVLLIASMGRLSVDYVLSGICDHGLAEIRRLYRLYDARDDGQIEPRELELPSAAPAQLIAHKGRPLYLVRVDEKRLLAAARSVGGVVLVPFAIGDAVIPGDTLALVYDAKSRIPEKVVRDAIVLRRARDIDEHPEYALRLLVDIAIRALSPAINDPSTAVAALDMIEALLRAFGNADLARGRIRDEQGRLRALHMQPSWDDLLSLALTEIAQAGAESVQVQRRLGALLEDLAVRVPEPRRAPIERLLARRERAIELGEISSEAACRDRQGLGHTLGTLR